MAALIRRALSEHCRRRGAFESWFVNCVMCLRQKLQLPKPDACQLAEAVLQRTPAKMAEAFTRWCGSYGMTHSFPGTDASLRVGIFLALFCTNGSLGSPTNAAVGPACVLHAPYSYATVLDALDAATATHTRLWRKILVGSTVAALSVQAVLPCGQADESIDSTEWHCTKMTPADMWRRVSESCKMWTDAHRPRFKLPAQLPPLLNSDEKAARCGSIFRLAFPKRDWHSMGIFGMLEQGVGMLQQSSNATMGFLQLWTSVLRTCAGGLISNVRSDDYVVRGGQLVAALFVGAMQRLWTQTDNNFDALAQEVFDAVRTSLPWPWVWSGYFYAATMLASGQTRIAADMGYALVVPGLFAMSCAYVHLGPRKASVSSSWEILFLRIARPRVLKTSSFCTAYLSTLEPFDAAAAAELGFSVPSPIADDFFSAAAAVRCTNMSELHAALRAWWGARKCFTLSALLSGITKPSLARIVPVEIETIILQHLLMQIMMEQ